MQSYRRIGEKLSVTRCISTQLLAYQRYSTLIFDISFISYSSEKCTPWSNLQCVSFMLPWWFKILGTPVVAYTFCQTTRWRNLLNAQHLKLDSKQVTVCAAYYSSCRMSCRNILVFHPPHFTNSVLPLCSKIGRQKFDKRPLISANQNKSPSFDALPRSTNS